MKPNFNKLKNKSSSSKPSFAELRAKNKASKTEQRNQSFVTWSDMEGDDVVIFSIDGDIIDEENNGYIWTNFVSAQAYKANLADEESTLIEDCRIPLTAFLVKKIRNIHSDTRFIMFSEHELVTRSGKNDFHSVVFTEFESNPLEE